MGPTATVAESFEISETEVTYELWNAVHTWATANGYAFQNSGQQGASAGSCGGGLGDNGSHPVTCVSWRDVTVWTNALTEYYNAQNGTSLEGLYYTDAAHTNLQKDSTDATCGAATLGLNPGDCDSPHVKPNATGFRLPTLYEWEIAARYKDDTNNDGDITDAGEYYPGDYASGAGAPYTNAPFTDIVAVNSSNSGGSTATVKSKAANTLGFFDISGNVWEWNQDWLPYSGGDRGFRGGSWWLNASFNQVGLMNGSRPYNAGAFLGFRLAKTP